MGKKAPAEVNKNNLFEDLLNDEQKRTSAPKESTQKLDLSLKTKTKAAVTETATAVSKKGKNAFEGLDPLLQKLLVHPDDENSAPGGANAKEPSSVVPMPTPKPTPIPTPKAKAAAPVSAPIDRDSDKTQKIQIVKDTPEPPKMHVKAHKSQASTSLEEQLQSANYLELAQNRVLELEKEVQKLRRDNEQLASAGQHFKSFAESIKQQQKQAEANFHNLKDIAEEEKKILTQSLEAKEIKIDALQNRLIEVEEKLNSSFDHVRIRERELENRLEIMKTEAGAVTTSKDEMILDLKKQLTLVNSDLEKYRIQNQKITAKMDNKEELLRRTVKALRIALTMLEGSHPEED